MPMAQRLQDDERRTRGVATGTEVPRTASDLRDWVREEIPLVEERANRLFAAIESVLAAQRQLIEESKHEAIRALSEGFAEKLSRLQRQLSEKDVTVSNIARYFEEVVAGLTDKSHRDPKT
jgi:molybdopterin converting factor small subunit